eukprot:11468715-Alexandrium_andersonii.AAC.1
MRRPSTAVSPSAVPSTRDVELACTRPIFATPIIDPMRPAGEQPDTTPRTQRADTAPGHCQKHRRDAGHSWTQ